MNDMREALEAVRLEAEELSKHFNRWQDVRAQSYVRKIAGFAAEALAAPKWTFPDEDTPGEAPEWRYQADPMDYSFYSWKLRDHREPHNEDPVKVVVLARFNEGPPTPEETRQIMERADED